MKSESSYNPFRSPQSELEGESLPAQDGGPVNYAGFFARFFALFIDLIISYLLIFGINHGIKYLIDSLGTKVKISVDETIEVIGVLLLIAGIWALIPITFWLYFAIMESSPLQATIGKMLLGLKVVNLSSERIRFSQATGRHFGHYLSSIFLIGFLVQPFHSRKQAWHDSLSNTLVLRNS